MPCRSARPRLSSLFVTGRVTPAYLIWIEHRPTYKGRDKEAYHAAVKNAARAEIDRPISSSDIEVEIVDSTRRPLGQRMDADNVNKPTLDRVGRVPLTHQLHGGVSTSLETFQVQKQGGC